MTASRQDQRDEPGSRTPRPARPNGKPEHDEDAEMPLEVDGHLSVFDRFATASSDFVSRAWFFLACVLLVVLWAPSILVLPDINTWQLIINTVTTIVTFLLVALLQNTQKRADDAIQHKLNAIADGLADLMAQMSDNLPDLQRDQRELRAAVGLEQRESAD
jgi:hypothetical protein